MHHHASYLTKTIFMATCLTLGCTSSGALGCGSSGGGGPTVDSELLGVYKIDRYRGNEDGCDPVTDVELAPANLVLYSYRPSNDSNEVRLAGTFCGGVDNCRDLAQQGLSPTLGYSFIQGSDEAGWLGWGITNTGNLNDECQADVQAHTLTSTSAQVIHIETRTVETVFKPTLGGDGGDATCSNADALAAAANEDLPCKALLLVDATFEAEL